MERKAKRSWTDLFSDIISWYMGQERSMHLLVRLPKHQNNAVLIHAEAQSRQEDSWGDRAKELELYENISGHKKRIFRD